MIISETVNSFTSQLLTKTSIKDVKESQVKIDSVCIDIKC